MKEKQLTLLLLGHEPEGIRQLSVSLRALRWMAWGLGALSLVILVLGGLLLFNGGVLVRARSLAKENSLLAAELRAFRDRVDGLEETIDGLGEQDSRFRRIAGLEAMDEEILEVGVGGPGSILPPGQPLWSVDSILGNEAFAVEYDLSALERRVQLLSASLTEASDTLAAHEEILQATPSIWPTVGVLSSRFSTARYHPIYHQTLPHEGIDISAPTGTPILASANGRVTFAGRRSGLGLTVEIDHGHGFKTVYGHASRILVARGETVSRGEVIAHVGSTGISTSPHLHYEVHVGGVAVNPMNYVIRSVLP